jgi:hypothetical protein
MTVVAMMSLRVTTIGAASMKTKTNLGGRE